MDLLTYVPNINVFRQALRDINDNAPNPEAPDYRNFVTIDENNDVKLLIDTVPVRYNGDKSLTLLRTNEVGKAFLESIPAVDILGEYQGGEDYEFYSDKPSNRNKYKSVYDSTPYEDEEGNTITPPIMFGVFL